MLPFISSLYPQTKTMKTTVSVFRKTTMNSQEVYSIRINNEHIYTVVTKNASTMIHADEIPESLHGFLSNPYFRFVGVGIQSDVDKLGCDYNIGVMNTFDLGNLAAVKYGNKGFKNVGLMGLAEVVLGCGEIEKPRNVTLSNWDQYHLTPAQIKYACVDAYVSFKIGKQLLQV
ncbi:hypothetical protein MKW98_010962 [Papaver atlanticum]|uniref:3'-5' exonuclease domain-containing protein n=1 Tax=Papaver atlanticum TaxID=357466 RepID=A0AAD4XZV9_9MAGN|nr:hypothetical protein MKW98_010962 [Papaver atlanticum]